MSSEIAISWPGVNPARSIARISASSAASLVSKAGQNPPSSATPCNRPRSAMIAPAARYTSAVHSSAWSNEARERRDDHEILDIDPPPGMRAAAENLDFRQRHHRLAAVAEQIGIERLAVRRGGGVQRGHRYRDQRIAAEPAFLRRAVERDQRAVDRGLVGGVHARSARRRSRR